MNAIKTLNKNYKNIVSDLPLHIPNLKHEKVQAITVCIFFSDYLKYCINNRQYFDRWLIVTVESDIDTIALCKKFSLEYCFTNRIFENGSSFAKGKAINDGLPFLDKEGWILHVDCDIILPKNFRKFIDEIPKNEISLKSLFGLKGRRALGAPPGFVCTRDFKNYEKFHLLFKKETSNSSPTQNANIRYLASSFKKMRRKCGIKDKAGPLKDQWKHFTKFNWDQLVYNFEGGEFRHLGYFQLFHSKYFDKYPERSKDANHDDVAFRDSFPKSRRVTFDCDCVHIGLPKSGKMYAHFLDALVFSQKCKSEYAYLNELKKIKKANSSKLTIRKNGHSRVSKERLYLLNEFEKTSEISSPANGWIVWNDSLLQFRTQVRKSKKKLLLAYEFFPNPKNEWFGFSIEPLNLFDKSQYKYLFFDLKLEDLDCDLEVGYGNRDKTEWLRIRTSRLANRQWHQFKLEFNQNNCIDNLCTLLIFRSIGRFSRAKISVSEAYFTKGINA